jgi:hypothetical protein
MATMHRRQLFPARCLAYLRHAQRPDDLALYEIWPLSKVSDSRISIEVSSYLQFPSPSAQVLPSQPSAAAVRAAVRAFSLAVALEVVDSPHSVALELPSQECVIVGSSRFVIMVSWCWALVLSLIIPRRLFLARRASESIFSVIHSLALRAGKHGQFQDPALVAEQSIGRRVDAVE